MRKFWAVLFWNHILNLGLGAGQGGAGLAWAGLGWLAAGLGGWGAEAGCLGAKRFGQFFFWNRALNLGVGWGWRSETVVFGTEN